MNKRDHESSSNRALKIAFFAGTIPAFLIALIVVLFIGLRIGFSELGSAFSISREPDQVLVTTIDELSDSSAEQLFDGDSVFGDGGTQQEINPSPADTEVAVETSPSAQVDGADTPTPIESPVQTPSPALQPTPILELEERTLERSIEIANLGRRIPWSCNTIKDQDINEVFCLPQEILDELAGVQGVIGNAPNVIGTDEHDTILVRPDAELGYVLRPNVSVLGNVINPRKLFNVDPPVFYTPANTVFSDDMLRYLRFESLQSFTYTTDSDGFRTTIPTVDAQDKILLVGDSIVFGVGVDDESTIPSQLQLLLGDSIRAINAGVGGYDDDETFSYADRLTSAEEYEALIYVASNFDFRDGDTLTGAAESSMKRLASLQDRVAGPVVLILMPNMEYGLYDVYKGLPTPWVLEMDETRINMHTWAADADVKYIDFTEIVDDFIRQSDSVFAGFPLYVDHTHFSLAGNRLAAEALYEMLVRTGIVP